MTPIQQPGDNFPNILNDLAFQGVYFVALVINPPIIEGSGTGGESIGSYYAIPRVYRLWLRSKCSVKTALLEIWPLLFLLFLRSPAFHWIIVNDQAPVLDCKKKASFAGGKANSEMSQN